MLHLVDHIWPLYVYICDYIDLKYKTIARQNIESTVIIKAV